MTEVKDSFSIYWQAYAFEATTRLLASKIMHKPALLFPHMVNCAFSVELYLKCIYHIENRCLLSGHNLFDLFNQIGIKYQSDIEEEWNKHINANLARILDMNRSGFPSAATALREVLKVSGDAFTNARYFYENQNVGDFMIDSLPRCIRNVIDRDFPLWGSKADPSTREL